MFYQIYIVQIIFHLKSLQQEKNFLSLISLSQDNMKVRHLYLPLWQVCSFAYQVDTGSPGTGLIF
jgi:hypothetical protein